MTWKYCNSRVSWCFWVNFYERYKFLFVKQNFPDIMTLNLYQIADSNFSCYLEHVHLVTVSHNPLSATSTWVVVECNLCALIWTKILFLPVRLVFPAIPSVFSHICCCFTPFDPKSQHSVWRSCWRWPMQCMH